MYVQWGTASEYSNYDSTNRTVVDGSQRAYKHILVDPRMTPLGKEADVWRPLRVGTDLCLSLGWLKWILDNEAYDDAFVRRWTNAPFLWNPEKDGRTAKGWFMEMNGGIDMESRILTEADCDPEWIGQYWDYEGRYQRFICWDENNNKPTYWDAEACQWEGEKHKIPTTGTWIEHPYKPIIADAWLPDPSKFADPADAQYDAYWDCLLYTSRLGCRCTSWSLRQTIACGRAAPCATCGVPVFRLDLSSGCATGCTSARPSGPSWRWRRSCRWSSLFGMAVSCARDMRTMATSEVFGNARL